ncbi:hypothetical protein CONPUDRAFT_72317 [Coniophora puteana RWD-64-598 SS2]|uniref:F-box domain-containing protein n=1 Tax=Coniophora puteana (strain RWD-64-598) TaxID=741705 RepID=A0A5M3MS41_CONPW|nr:uncharacterized protein CONPUDRAFT_72317 [Coniophora puteana RWD-64-598 SS2]EIW81968.1 hypothetical protein CONPUDRAFT_72317 [Coniophora puteana RWD-64-598 SS2]
MSQYTTREERKTLFSSRPSPSSLLSYPCVIAKQDTISTTGKALRHASTAGDEYLTGISFPSWPSNILTSTSQNSAHPRHSPTIPKRNQRPEADTSVVLGSDEGLAAQWTSARVVRETQVVTLPDSMTNVSDARSREYLLRDISARQLLYLKPLLETTTTDHAWLNSPQIDLSQESRLQTNAGTAATGWRSLSSAGIGRSDDFGLVARYVTSLELLVMLKAKFTLCGFSKCLATQLLQSSVAMGTRGGGDSPSPRSARGDVPRSGHEYPLTPTSTERHHRSRELKRTRSIDGDRGLVKRKKADTSPPNHTQNRTRQWVSRHQRRGVGQYAVNRRPLRYDPSVDNNVDREMQVNVDAAPPVHIEERTLQWVAEQGTLKRSCPFEDSGLPYKRSKLGSLFPPILPISLPRVIRLRRHDAIPSLPAGFCPFQTLPIEVMLQVYDNLDLDSRLTAAQVCRNTAAAVARLIPHPAGLKDRYISVSLLNIRLLVVAARLQTLRLDAYLACHFPDDNDTALLFVVRGLALVAEFVPGDATMSITFYPSAIPCIARQGFTTLIRSIHCGGFQNLAIHDVPALEPPSRLQRNSIITSLSASSYRELTLSTVAFQPGIAFTTRQILNSSSSIQCLSLASVRLKPSQWKALLEPLTIRDLDDFSVPASCPSTTIQKFLGRHPSMSYLNIEQHGDQELTSWPANFRIPNALASFAAPLFVWKRIGNLSSVSTLFHASVYLSTNRRSDVDYFADIQTALLKCKHIRCMTVTLPPKMVNWRNTPGVDTGVDITFKPLIGLWIGHFPDLRTFRFRAFTAGLGPSRENALRSIEAELRDIARINEHPPVDQVSGMTLISQWLYLIAVPYIAVVSGFSGIPTAFSPPPPHSFARRPRRTLGLRLRPHPRLAAFRTYPGGEATPPHLPRCPLRPSWPLPAADLCSQWGLSACDRNTPTHFRPIHPAIFDPPEAPCPSATSTLRVKIPNIGYEKFILMHETELLERASLSYSQWTEIKFTALEFANLYLDKGRRYEEQSTVKIAIVVQKVTMKLPYLHNWEGQWPVRVFLLRLLTGRFWTPDSKEAGLPAPFVFSADSAPIVAVKSHPYCCIEASGTTSGNSAVEGGSGGSGDSTTTSTANVITNTGDKLAEFLKNKCMTDLSGYQDELGMLGITCIEDLMLLCVMGRRITLVILAGAAQNEGRHQGPH